MAQDEVEIFEQVAQILRTHSKSPVEVTMDTNIAVDLALDSVAMFELMMEIEDHFDIGFSIEEGSNLQAVGSLVAAISEKKNFARSA